MRVLPFQKQTGSSRRIRTYNPFVNSPEISRLFSGPTSGCRGTRTVRNLCSVARSRGLCRAYQLCVSLHISAAATGNAGLCIAAVVGAALGHVKYLRSCSCAPFARLQFLLQYLRLVALGRGKHLRIAMCRTVPVRLGGIDSCFDCCLGSSFAAVIGTTWGA
jgi:hypothetical protein